jgi:hypothetical protein
MNSNQSNKKVKEQTPLANCEQLRPNVRLGTLIVAVLLAWIVGTATLQGRSSRSTRLPSNRLV